MSASIAGLLCLVAGLGLMSAWVALHWARRGWARLTRGRLVLTIGLAFLALGLLGVGLVSAAVALHRTGGSRLRHPRGRLLLFAGTAFVVVGLVAVQVSLPDQRLRTLPATGSENMADLFNAADQDYGDNPLRIATVGAKTDNTIVVLLAGQVTNHISGSIQAGLGMRPDPRVDLVRSRIESYRSQQGLAAGTTVILAGHSYGGMIAEELASDPGATDFTVAAVATWGSPNLTSRVRGVHYQQYFSQYDYVPLLSSYELAPMLPLTGSVGSLVALATMQTFPGLKAAFTGQTYVPDMGQYWSPQNWIHADGTWNDAHDAYAHSSWLARQTLTFWRDGKQLLLAEIPYTP